MCPCQYYLMSYNYKLLVLRIVTWITLAYVKEFFTKVKGLSSDI